jgi:hypothetical protein
MLRNCGLPEESGELPLRDGIVKTPSLVDDTIMREMTVVRRARLRNVKVRNDGHGRQLIIYNPLSIFPLPSFSSFNTIYRV